MKRFWSLLACAIAFRAPAQGTVFTYQGSLNDEGHGANGLYDFTFALYDSTNVPGNLVGGAITNAGVMVTNGLFAAPLNFGNVFDGSARWLEVGVRTNGATNFVTLNPRQAIMPVPYAMFSGGATNLTGPLSAANLAPVAAMIASASNGLSSAFTTNVASFTNSGLESAADAIRLASVPEQQEGIQRTPIRGYLSYYATGINVSEPYVSNVMYTTKSTGLYNYGYDWLFVDEGWGATNRDANGDLQWNTNKFPSGANFVNVAHKMGFKIALYTDGYPNITATGGQASSDTKEHMARDVNQFLKWGIDGGKWDESVENVQVGMAVLATNTAQPFYVICGYPFGDVAPTAQWASLMNAWRGGGDVGDLVVFSRLPPWCDQFATNGFYRWIRPGHVYDFDAINNEINAGVEPGTGRGTQAQIVMDAIVSGIMLHSLNDENGNIVPSTLPFLTNSSVLDIQADPAVIAGQRVMQTNNVDVWLKPLGSENGPQFAIGMICRGGNTSNVSVTVDLGPNGLNLPAASRQNIGYSIYDCISNAWTSVAGVSIFTTVVTNHQSELFRLYPGTVITTNYIQPFAYAPTLPAIVISNGTQRVVNVPWDADAANFIERAGVTNDPVQCFAVQFLFTKLKTFGLWTNRLDVLYPMIPGQPYLNAFSTNFTLVPVGAVSSGPTGIAGDGSSSYFTNGYHFINSAVHYSLNSASVGIYNGTALPAGSTLIGGFDGVSETAFINYFGTFFGAANDLSGNQINYNYDARGLWIDSRLGPVNACMSDRGIIFPRTAASISVPNTYITLDGEFRGGAITFLCNAEFRGAWIGGGIATVEIPALNSIWDEYEAILGRAAP